MAPNFKKTGLVISSIAVLSLGLVACSDTSSDESAPGTSSATSISVEKGPQPTLSSSSEEPRKGDENLFSEILSQAPEGSQYAEVDITADGKPELLLQTPDVNGERNEWPVVHVFDSQGSKYSVSVNGNDGFWNGSGNVSFSRTKLQATADNTGLLFTSWSGTAPEVNTQLWTVEGNTLVASGKAWDYTWKGDGSGIQDDAPEDLRRNAVDIDWKDVKESAEGSAGAQEQQAQQSNSGRSKADFPYFTSGQTGTASNAGQANSTSPEFGRAVYNAFIEHWIATGDSQPQLQVASPVTGQTYSMSCVDQGAYSSVLCSGGNNAKVYIYHPIDDSVTKPSNLQYG